MILAATTMQWFERFPALWAVAGIVLSVVVVGIGCVIAVIVIRKYGPAVGDANRQLVEAQKQQLNTVKETSRIQIEAHERQLVMQKTHYEEELKERDARYSAELTEWKSRHDILDKHLHDKRNDWDAEKLHLIAENEQLKSRPDVTTLFEFETKADERREAFYKLMGETLKSIGESINSHDADVDGRIKPMSNALTVLVTLARRQSKVLGIILREIREERKLAENGGKK